LRECYEKIGKLESALEKEVENLHVYKEGFVEATRMVWKLEEVLEEIADLEAIDYMLAPIKAKQILKRLKGGETTS